MLVIGRVNKRLNFGGDPDHRLDIGIVFRMRHCWKIRKAVSTDCDAAVQDHALAGVAIATMTSLRHRPTTGSHVHGYYFIVTMATSANDGE